MKNLTQKVMSTKAKDFFFAGKAIVTLKNIHTGNRFTYKVTKARGDKNIHFISVFVGTDNTNPYAYSFIGTVFEHNSFKYSSKAKMPLKAKPVAIINTFLSFLSNNSLPKGVEMWHEGKCGCCGRRLTVPESISSGFGKLCLEKKQKYAQTKLELTLTK